MQSPTPQRKPWPMIWIISAIVLFVAGYTFISLRYRKPGRAYQPVEDTKNRVNTARLISAGYQRVHVPVQFPVSIGNATNTALPAPGGLPESLRTALVTPPALPSAVASGRAETTGSADEPYTILFRCVLPDEKRAVASADVYVHANEILIAPNVQKLSSGLLTRSRDPIVSLTIPANSIKPGRYHVTLVGETSSRSWDLVLR